MTSIEWEWYLIQWWRGLLTLPGKDESNRGSQSWRNWPSISQKAWIRWRIRLQSNRTMTSTIESDCLAVTSPDRSDSAGLIWWGSRQSLKGFPTKERTELVAAVAATTTTTTVSRSRATDRRQRKRHEPGHQSQNTTAKARLGGGRNNAKPRTTYQIKDIKKEERKRKTADSNTSRTRLRVSNPQSRQ